jgi:hypothetical protein
VENDLTIRVFEKLSTPPEEQRDQLHGSTSREKTKIKVCGRFNYNSWFQVPFQEDVTLTKGHKYVLTCQYNTSLKYHCTKDHSFVKQISSVLSVFIPPKPLKIFGTCSDQAPEGLTLPFRALRYSVLE